MAFVIIFFRDRRSWELCSHGTKRKLSHLFTKSKIKMHTNADFSVIFTNLLKQTCLSQLEIAERTGIHKQTINRYATAKTVPGWAELIKLADALGCSLDSFRTGELTPSDTIDASKLEQMKPIIKELGSVVNKLTSFISE